jgi:hypothetical protein
MHQIPSEHQGQTVESRANIDHTNINANDVYATWLHRLYDAMRSTPDVVPSLCWCCWLLLSSCIELLHAGDSFRNRIDPAMNPNVIANLLPRW